MPLFTIWVCSEPHVALTVQVDVGFVEAMKSSNTIAFCFKPTVKSVPQNIKIPRPASFPFFDASDVHEK
jgi:hypothetical protein